MGKLSKKFRQLPVIKTLISFRKNLFGKSKKYQEFRNLVRHSKWCCKFYFYPRYRKIAEHLKQKDYSQICVYRPTGTFHEFDLGLKAKNKADETVFIQVITKEHFDSKERKMFDHILASFRKREKLHKALFKGVSAIDASKANDLIEVVEFDVQENSGIFITKFRNFMPLLKYVETQGYDEKSKQALIEQVKFYKNIFNDCKIYWNDANPHNVMIDKKSLNLVPIDFVSYEIVEESQIEKLNERSAGKVIEYLETGVYPWVDKS